MVSKPKTIFVKWSVDAISKTEVVKKQMKDHPVTQGLPCPLGVFGKQEIASGCFGYFRLAPTDPSKDT